jgi:hypothetical protein
MARQATAPAALEQTFASLEGRTLRGRASVSLENPTPLEWISASLEGQRPRVGLRLARVSRDVSPTPPDQSIKCPATSRASRSKATDIARESGPGAMRTSPPLCYHPRGCAAWSASLRGIVPSAPILLPHHAP